VKYISKFRDQEVAKQLSASIAETVDSQRRYRLMEFCGGKA